jgi:hypothetical protein
LTDAHGCVVLDLPGAGGPKSDRAGTVGRFQPRRLSHFISCGETHRAAPEASWLQGNRETQKLSWVESPKTQESRIPLSWLARIRANLPTMLSTRWNGP